MEDHAAIEIERRKDAGGRTVTTDQRQMIHQVRTYLRSTQRMPEVVRNYFHAPDVAYASR